MKAVVVKNLIKKYDDILAVENISFDVEEDSFFAFLGPNGAGKSTTINILATLLNYQSGDIEIFGNKLGINDNLIRNKIGIVFQKSMLDDLLTVRENLEIRSSFYGLSKKDFKDRIVEINEFINIDTFIDQKYMNLSGGQRRKADIVRALLNWPDLLILDEPTTGLDPMSRKDIWKLIAKLRAERNITIFLTTHYMEEVKDANKVVIINEGKIVAQGSSEELRSKYSFDRIKIIPKGNLLAILNNDNIEYTIINDTININLSNSFEGIDIALKYKDSISEFEILRGDMDDVFLNITGRKLVNNK